MVEPLYAKEKPLQAILTLYVYFSLKRMSFPIRPVGLVSTAPFWKYL